MGTAIVALVRHSDYRRSEGGISLFDGSVKVSIAAMSGQWTVQVDDYLNSVKTKRRG